MKKKISFLLQKYLEGNASPEEIARVDHWYQDAAPGQQTGPTNKEQVKEQMFRQIRRQLAAGAKLVPFYRRSFFRIAAAACLVLLISVGGYLAFNKKSGQEQPPVAKADDVEAPKATKARITLSDGRSVSIDSLSSLTQHNVSVVKTKDGKIIYTGTTSDVAYNTLTNPKGSKVIDMQLADSSHVWLNAGSSITYPVAFVGNERKISITGEAYFEIVHNPAMPFKVSKAEMEVTVLGTHFNVNAYDDEAEIKVTLLEGSVRVSKGNSSDLLRPGQQAQVGDVIKIVNGIDTDEVMAWRNGLFSFNRADIGIVMREISRWYSVEVIYQGEPPVMRFGGKLERNLNLSQVLKALEKSEVRFKIEGNKIIVLR